MGTRYDRWSSLVLTAVLCAIAGAAGAGGMSVDDLKGAFRRPAGVPFPKSDPYTPQIAALGKMLFFDPRLSGSQTTSCATCHNPSFGFEGPMQGAVSGASKAPARKPGTILDAAFSSAFFWDGRASNLEEAAAEEITAANAMNGSFPQITERLGKVSSYRAWFDRLFPGEGLTKANLLTTIATYQRTIVADEAPFDRWIEGDGAAIPPEAQRGFALFVGKAKCSACHTGWTFTDDAFHDIGLPTTDIGRGRIEPRNALAPHAFKTPTLRDLTSRAPYGHHGQFADLDAVIAFYNGGGIDRPSKALQVEPLGLSPGEVAELKAFLLTLSAPATETALPRLPE